MNWNRWSTATGTTLCANACACRTAKDLKTRSGTPTCALGSARRHPASAINISISTIANANSTSKSAPQGFSSTLRPANVSVSKTKAVAPTSTGTTSSASASANPRRAPLLNTGTLVFVACRCKAHACAATEYFDYERCGCFCKPLNCNTPGVGRFELPKEEWFDYTDCSCKCKYPAHPPNENYELWIFDSNICDWRCNPTTCPEG